MAEKIVLFWKDLDLTNMKRDLDVDIEDMSKKY